VYQAIQGPSRPYPYVPHLLTEVPNASPSQLNPGAMDPNVQRALNDKLYDKRKLGALE